MQRIIIFANGELPDLEQARAILRDDDYILSSSSPPSAVAWTKPSPTSPLLSNLQLATFNIRLTDGVEELFFCRDQAKSKEEAETSSHSSPGREKSPASSPKTCAGIFITKRLYPDKTRGISNEMTADIATVSIKRLAAHHTHHW
jgi:hypothetical protein